MSKKNRSEEVDNYVLNRLKLDYERLPRCYYASELASQTINSIAVGNSLSRLSSAGIISVTKSMYANTIIWTVTNINSDFTGKSVNTVLE